MRLELAAGRRTSAARVCLAAALSVTSIGAAAATSSASLQNFAITVEDLDLSDGIEAGYTFSLSEQTIDARAPRLSAGKPSSSMTSSSPGSRLRYRSRLVAPWCRPRQAQAPSCDRPGPCRLLSGHLGPTGRLGSRCEHSSGGLTGTGSLAPPSHGERGRDVPTTSVPLLQHSCM